MLKRQSRPRRRTGAVALETGLVLIWFLTFIFAIFEYSRFVMDRGLLNNAAREGCRYALANNTSSTLSADVTTLVTNYMSGQQSNFTGFSVSVSGTSSGTLTTVSNLEPGDMVTVTVSGTYKFMNIIPLVSLPTSLSVSSAVTMVCEGGT